MFDLLYLVIAGVTMLLSLAAAGLVRYRVSQARQVPSRGGMTGAEAAALILRRTGLDDLRIEEHAGVLSDHYNPMTRTLALSHDVFHGRDAAAVGIAAHEAGHAIQHAQGYTPMWLRSLLVPAANLGSMLGPWLVIGGIVLGAVQQHAAPGLAWWLAAVGLGLFGLAASFTLVTLPVEFDASARARVLLVEYGVIGRDEDATHVDRVLTAAGLTYVAAAATSVLWLLYWAWQAGFIGGNRDR
jgi:Zn-dependent membrane protease YugP